MEANTRHLERIFDQTITYQIPLFQRPYVWTKARNWEPLWEDIQSLLDRHLRGAKIHPHFLGAVVLEQLANSTGSIGSRQVIDGQQRFTTLQLFLIAARDHAMKHGIQKYIERFTDLVGNRRSKIDHDHEVFKVWPTNGDRAAYRAVHEAGSLAALDKAAKLNLQLKEGTHNIIEAYRYFYDQLGDWIAGKQDDADDACVLMGKMSEDRFESLWQVVKGQLQVVVIDLDKDDETQVIFETLNARGEDLLPADLIKNYLFRRCAANEDDVEALYERHWRPFDVSFWRQEITQGRLKRPRIDIYIQHYLTLMTREEIKASHLFNAFKNFEKQPAAPDDAKIPYPTTPADHIVQLSRYAEVFRTFQEPGKHVRLAGQRHRVVNTLGNLTLITGSLNPSLSNGSWVMKRPELIKFSKLNLNQYFHGKEADVWDEDAIGRRAEKLFEDARAVWPGIHRLMGD